MGNIFHKCKCFDFVSHHKEIISEKALRSVFVVAEFLKLNVQNRDMFRDTGYRRHVKQIAAYIDTGNPELHNLLMQRTVVEAAAGLQYFLVRLSGQLLPKYVQDLALETDVDVEPEIIAEDILGLIRQDVSGRQYELIFALLDLLWFLRKHAVSDELSGSSMPLTLLPVFFNLQQHHLRKWRTIANIFMEMIELSPVFDITLHSTIYESDTVSEINNPVRFDDPVILPGNLQQDMVLRRVLVRTGSEGDANFPEIINIIRRQDLPKMLNNVFGYYIKKVF